VQRRVVEAVPVAYVRTVRTSSGAVAVQVVWKSRHGSRDIEHLGSAHTDAEVEVLKAVAAQRIADGQDELPFGVPARQEPVSLEITSSRMGRLLDAVAAVYRQLGLDKACGLPRVFRTVEFVLFHAASCSFKYSMRASCGVR
jgi:hypothetical protein